MKSELLNKLLGEPICNMCHAFADDFCKANADQRQKMGIKSQIIRTENGNCCEWCKQMAGVHDYNSEDNTYFRRHAHCKCTLTIKTEKRRDSITESEQAQNDKSVRIEMINELETIKAVSSFLTKINLGDGMKLDVWEILEYNKIEIDIKETVHAAKEGKRHRGIYKDAIQKNERQLRKSIESHSKEVREHAEKIKHPAVYDVGWGEKSEANQNGLIKKWGKDMKRNAEQAIIEAAVYAERFK